MAGASSHSLRERLLTPPKYTEVSLTVFGFTESESLPKGFVSLKVEITLGIPKIC